MKFIETSLPGVMVVEPRVFIDERGYFYESYNAAKFAAGGIDTRFLQDNQSRSSYGVIRGLHGQAGVHAQAKLVRVLEGRILDVAVDIRRDSPTFGNHISIELSEDNQRELFIPRGFLHGFSVFSDTAVIHYKCDNLYNKEAEIGVRYDDPVLGIDWGIPESALLVSEKDRCLRGLDHVAHYGE